MKITKATPSETKQIVKAYNDAQNMPVMVVNSAQALSGNDFSYMAWKRCYELITRLAIKHGHKDNGKQYGFNAETREFIKP